MKRARRLRPGHVVRHVDSVLLRDPAWAMAFGQQSRRRRDEPGRAEFQRQALQRGLEGDDPDRVRRARHLSDEAMRTVSASSFRQRWLHLASQRIPLCLPVREEFGCLTKETRINGSTLGVVFKQSIQLVSSRLPFIERSQQTSIVITNWWRQ